MATVTIPDLSAVYSWLKANWGSIAALSAAIATAFFPAASDRVQAILTLISALLGAGAVGSITARTAVRSEARRLGLFPSK